MMVETDLWYRRQLRIVQTVLREVDIEQYDAAGVVAYLEKVRANCLVVNAGGIVDFFPIDMPGTTPNQFLGNQDILREITSLAHQAGIRVLARVDFRGVTQSVYDEYPDWFARTIDDKPMLTGYTGTPLYTTCYNGFYRNEHAIEYIRFLMRQYDLDGIWHNSVAVWGVCYCSRCRERFKLDTGKELDAEIGQSGSYWEWKACKAEDNVRLMRDTVKAFGNSKAYAAEIFGMYDTNCARNSGLDLYTARKYFDFLVSVAFLTENRENPVYEDPGYVACLVRFMRALDQSLQPVVLFGTNGTTHRYVMDPPDDLRVWMWMGTAGGSGFWNCLFNGQHPAATHDRRNAFLERQTYAWLEHNQVVLGDMLPVAPIRIFYSRPTRTVHGSDDPLRDNCVGALRGAAMVLLENHLQFGYVCDVNFNYESLRDTRLLVLPNISCISDQHIEVIRKYVRNGGALLATFESTLCDQHGNRREDFGLADLFGISYTGENVNTGIDCYQLIRSRHSILDGFEQTELLINGGETVLVGVPSAAYSSILCTHVPKIPNQPPEFAWTSQMATPNPTIVVNSYGKGKVVYFANQIDLLCALNGHGDFRHVYRNALFYLLGEYLDLETSAPSSVCISMLRGRADPGRYVVSFVNTTSGPRRPFREIVPVHDIETILHLPGSKVAGWQSLTEDTSVALGESHTSGDVLKVQLKIKRLKWFASALVEIA